MSATSCLEHGTMLQFLASDILFNAYCALQSILLY